MCDNCSLMIFRGFFIIFNSRKTVPWDGEMAVSKMLTVGALKVWILCTAPKKNCA